VDGYTGKVLEPLKQRSGENVKDVISMFCLHPNGEEAVIATQRSLIQHWNLKEKTLQRSMKGHSMPILAMTYDSTGTLVATGSADRSVRVWDIEKGFCTHSFREHTDVVRFAMFHPNPDQSLLISAADDNSIRLWDLINSTCIATFKEHISPPRAISISPNGYMLMSAGLDQVINTRYMNPLPHPGYPARLRNIL
jgi:U3 small nucleolar RNA-associated protein 13